MKILSQKEYNSMQRAIAELEGEVKDLKNDIADLGKKTILKSVKGRPFLVFKLGDPHKGWIPGKVHETALRKRIKDAKIDESYNILIFHYGLDIQKVEKK